MELENPLPLVYTDTFTDWNGQHECSPYRLTPALRQEAPLYNRVPMLLSFLLCTLLALLESCAGNSRVVGEQGGSESGQYMLYVANYQGNPLCLYVSEQKARVKPWMGSPETRWRVHGWLAVPGASRELFYEKGNNKKAISAPVKWTKKSLLFTTDSDQFIFF